MYKHFAAPLILALLMALTCVSLPGLRSAAPEAFAQTTSGKADVFFKLNEFAFGPGGEAALKEIARTMKNNPGAVLVIEGYSDVTGDDEYNLNLSRRRAEAVRQFYVAEGVAPGRITVSGKGKTSRFASGSDESSLRLNRRVTIALEPGTAPESVPDPAPAAPEAAARAPESESQPESEAPPKEIIDAITINETEIGPEPTPVPGPESASETPSEPGVVSPEVSEMLGNSMRRLTAGRIVFDTPGEMSVGESYAIEATVTHRFLKDLSQSLAEGGADGNLKLGDNITLHLKGNGFDITPVPDSTIGAAQEFPIDDTEDAKTIAEDSTASWEWSVKPEKSGFQTLLLSVEVAVEDEHLREILAESPVFEKVVQVKSSFFHSISKSYLLMAVIIVIAVAAVGWALIKKLRLG